MQLYIHIGAPKTGTTAVQQFLHANREALARAGILYPTAGTFRSRHQQAAREAIAHHAIGAAIFPSRASRLGNVDRNKALFESIFQIKKEIAKRKPHTVILSTEYLWGYLAAADIRRLLEHWDGLALNLVVYLRRQDLLAQSLYLQSIKAGSSATFMTWFERWQGTQNAGLDFYSVLRAWRDSGFQIKFVVRVYEAQQLDGDICHDFINGVVGAPPDGLMYNSAPVNVASDETTIELLRRFNARFGADPALELQRRRLLAFSPPRQLFAPLNYFPPGAAQKFMRSFAEQNSAVAKEYLGREDGILFREPVPSDDGRSTIGPQADELLDRVVELLPRLLDGGAVKR